MIDEEVVPALDGKARYRRQNGRFQRLWWAQAALLAIEREQ